MGSKTYSAFTVIILLGALVLVYSQVREPKHRSVDASTVGSEHKVEAVDSESQDKALTEEAKSSLGLTCIAVIRVTSVDPGSPAEQAGLQRGDYITRVGNMQVRGIQALKYVEKHDPGTLVDIEYVRQIPNSDSFTKYHAQVPLAVIKATQGN
jgi:S1-C subfamily serine protease